MTCEVESISGIIFFGNESGFFLVKKPYKMVQVPNPAAKQDSVAAKVFFEIRVGKVKLLDLQLRYKGDFKSQPQFFAFMTDDFKKLLKGECLDP